MTNPPIKSANLTCEEGNLNWVSSSQKGQDTVQTITNDGCLKETNFVIAEVRHNHESFSNQYKLHEFIDEMHKNDFILTMILTAKPLIADLCFEKKSNLRFDS